jgi:hypothetical protein
MNNRYQKGTKPAGATRKSASSVKPKAPRKKAAPTKKKTWRERLSGAGAGASKPKTDRSYLTVVPETPEYKALRKRWWICLGIAIVLLVASLVLQKIQATVSLALSWAALAFVAYSWWLDFKKIRPLIKEAQNAARKETKKAK